MNAEGVAALHKLGGILIVVLVLVVVGRVVVRRGLPSSIIGLAVGMVLLGIALWTNFDPNVEAVQERAFGARPLGLPVTWVVCAAEAVLLGPALLVLGPALLALAQELMGAEGAATKGGLLELLLFGRGLSDELRAARRRALVSGGYLIALMAAWIAFAAHKRI
jgi:hypothetical protein